MEVESGDEDDRAAGATGSDDEADNRKRKPKRRGGADTTVQDMEESGSESDEEEDEPPEVQMRAPPAQMPPQVNALKLGHCPFLDKLVIGCMIVYVSGFSGGGVLMVNFIGTDRNLF